MNNYLLESNDTQSIKKEEENIIKKNKYKDATISIYDMEETLLENALEDLDTYSFLSNKKVIIIQNIELVKEEEYKKDLEHLFKYIDNPNPDNLLIIEAKKLNNTLKITKKLKSKCEYINIVLDTKKYIKNTLKDYNISPEVISYLEELCLGDYTKVCSECEKLKNYKMNDKTITKEDLDEIVVKKLGDSKDLTFAFSKSIALKDKKDALKKYRELLSYNIEPISIIGLLASQIRIIYQVKILEKRNLRDREIAEILEEKSDYRIKKTRELTRLYTTDELLRLMQKLSDIDFEIKTGDIDPNTLMELFIINLEE